MKKILLTLLTIISASTLHADELLLFDNSTMKGEVISVTAESVKFKSSDGDISEISREAVEKIIYSGGQEVDLTDKIYLIDNRVISGRITGKSSGYIEYNPAGPIPYERVPAESVAKIMYSSGTVENYTQQRTADEIHLNDGRIIKGSNITVRDRYVEFINESGTKDSYGKDIIERIIYKSGLTVSFKEGGTEETGKENGEKEAASDLPSGMFLEFEWGWNGYAGAGMRFDYLFSEHFSLNGGAGVGLWGYRVSAALRYYPEYPYGLALSFGAALNTGGEIEDDFETTDGSGYTTTSEVVLELKPVVCLNASILYSWQVNGKDKIYIEGGYSYALRKKKYTYDTEDNSRLTDESEDIMDLLSPGGVILSAGYAFMF